MSDPVGATLDGEGDIQVIHRARERIPCDYCDNTPDQLNTYLLPNARHNPKSSAYGRDDCSWSSDHNVFSCEQCRKENFGGTRPNIEGYEPCATIPLTKQFSHLFLRWREKDITSKKAKPVIKPVRAWAMLDSKGQIRVRDIFDSKLGAEIIATRCDPGRRIIRVKVTPI